MGRDFTKDRATLVNAEMLFAVNPERYAREVTFIARAALDEIDRLNNVLAGAFDLKMMMEIESRANTVPNEWELKSFGDTMELRMGTAVDKQSGYEAQHVIEYEHGLFPEDGNQWLEAEAIALFIVHAHRDICWFLQQIKALQDSRTGAVCHSQLSFTK